MIRPLAASILAHLALAGALVRPAPAVERHAPRPVVVRLIEVPGGGHADVASKAPGELAGGHFSAAPKPSRAKRQKLRLEPVLVEGTRPAAETMAASLEDGSAEIEVVAPTLEQVPVGSGAGADGVGELGRGSYQALVQQRIQEVANIWSGARRFRTETFTFSVDQDGDVADRGHLSELDKILHLAEPFPSGGPYTVTVTY